MANKLKEALKQAKLMFSNIEKFADVKTDDGRIFHQTSDELTVGETIQEQTGEEEILLVDIVDGEYKLEDGRTLVIKDNILEEIIEKDEDESDDATTSTNNSEEFKVVKKMFSKQSTEQYLTSKFESEIAQIYKWVFTVENDVFEIGKAVTASYESYEGEMVTYEIEAGTYEIEDGRFITIGVDGIIVLITEADGTVTDTLTVGDNVDSEKEPVTETESETEEMFSMIKEITKELESLKKENNKFKEDFKKLTEIPTGEHTKTKMDFKSDYKEIKPKSKLHSNLGL